MYKLALKIAYQAHNGQLRKQSLVPYIVHPIRVASCFNDDTMKTIAILHDIVEDTDVTLKNLAKTFPPIIIETIDSLSRREGEQHFDYIKRCRTNELAKQIKIIDIVDNLSDTLVICEESMVKRYNKSLSMLINH